MVGTSPQAESDLWKVSDRLNQKLRNVFLHNTAIKENAYIVSGIVVHLVNLGKVLKDVKVGKGAEGR